jgi:glutamine synthetase
MAGDRMGSRTRFIRAIRWTRTFITCRPAGVREDRLGAGVAGEALDELEMDHDYLLKGDVFTADVIHYWIKYKRENEADAIRIRPHPYEFAMYFDI